MASRAMGLPMAEDDLRAAYRQFTTGVALITTRGSDGPNVMAAEWTFNVSYEPFLVSVHIHPEEATHAAIGETGEFGVNIVADDQVVAMGFAGHFSRHEVDKLTSDVFETYPATKIGAPLVRGALLNAECRLVQQVTMGDHTAFVGEVVAFAVDGSRRPIVLHRGARHLGPRIERDVTVAVAATPRRLAPGSTVRAHGELTAEEREGQRAVLRVEAPDGTPLDTREVATNRRGRFRGDLSVPEDAAPGRYVLRARCQGAEGTARFQVT